MSYGLGTWNADGTPHIRVTDALTRYIGSFTAGPAATGAVNFPGLAYGRPWVSVSRIPSSPAAQYIAPIVTVSGTTVSWVYGSTLTGNFAPAVVFVGVY